MRRKWLNVALVLASLVGYLEWGGGHSAFLLTAELEVIAVALRNPGSAVHPFTLLPLAGQVALLWTLGQKTPSTPLTLIGIAGIGLLLGLMFVIGILSRNAQIVVSTLPFLTLAVITLREHRRRR